MMNHSRPQEITEAFARLIDEHLADLEYHRATEMFEIEVFADKLCIHPTHLSNTVKEITGQSPCGIYQEKILNLARRLLSSTDRTVRDIAFSLDFEPSQFTKWFKRFNGTTPKVYRAAQILKS